MFVNFSRNEMQRNWAAQPQRIRRPVNVSMNSTTSVEIQTNSHPPASFVSPPGYYSEVMVTDSSAMYPVYVPPYSTTQSSPLMSLRDPRRFQQGEKNVAISKKLYVMRMAVHWIVKRYQELGPVEDYVKSGKPKSLDTFRV
uniref:Ras-GEF domain-containing protein n=1 Tax=Heterorhabditis bacteriophora TaxID=37862 RepID=A0A1I7XIV1_HETBA